jgi:hypothetical protein
LKEKAKSFLYCSLALDDSNDVSDAAQLFIFIRSIDNKFSLYVELASILRLHGSTTGEDLFMKVKEILSS